MHSKFFDNSKPDLFEKKVRAYIKQVNNLDKKKLQKQPDLGERILEINNIMQHTDFNNINTELKLELEKIFKKLDALNIGESMEIESQDCFIQIPAKEHIEEMSNMPAGSDEDQATRLSNIVTVIEQVHAEYSYLPVITTNQVLLAKEWQNLFAAINEGRKAVALELFNQISEDDIILQPLLAVHPKKYLNKIINYSIEAQRTGIKRVNADILITPSTFEILIRDIATTLMTPRKLCFSFGLPTHHAYSDESAGFCIINKTAVLMKHVELTHTTSLKYIIVGTDVNRDDGLCNILRLSASSMDICHVDIFDSRVYPHHNHSYINNEFTVQAKELSKKIKCWKQEQLEYYAVDLSLTTRNTVSVHPALLFALNKIKEQIVHAKQNDKKIFLLLPTGWDSHQEETAPCGKLIDGKMMGQYEASKTRFNSGDLNYFYSSVLALYDNNKEHIEGIYWGLEGGYDKRMYTKELGSMLQIIVEQPFCKDSNYSLTM